jgi:uncharacterized protein YndB with AHSA1/START domain
MTAEPAVDEGPGSSDGSRVEAHTVVARPVEDVWRVLAGPAGPEALLGPGATLGRKGEPWRADDGTHGVLRSYHPLEQVRFSWHADADAPATMVQLDLAADGDGTRISLRQEHLDGSADAGALRQRWAQALERLSAATT